MRSVRFFFALSMALTVLTCASVSLAEREVVPAPARSPWGPSTDTDLGVDALWLMPVFESPSYHGYDTIDYGKIASDYGTNAGFPKLLAEAHRRGTRSSWISS